MATIRTYTCNICHDRIESQNEGIGLYFSNSDERMNIHVVAQHFAQH